MIQNIQCLAKSAILPPSLILLTICFTEGNTVLRALQWKSMNKGEKLQREKLVRDRHIINNTIRRTLVEIVESGEWNSLKDAVYNLVQRASSALSKRSDHEKLKSSCNDIVYELESKREQWALELLKADQTIALLQDKIRDDQLNAKMRLCYAEKWLCARAESLELQHQKPRAPAPRIDLEHRAHDELNKAYELQIKEREELLEYWRLKYADDIANMNEVLSEKYQQLQIAIARHEELQNLYDLHEGEMRGWMNFKRERAARLAREERLRMSATRMQAWWRGVMVRRALGPFRYLRNVKKSPSKTKKNKLNN